MPDKTDSLITDELRAAIGMEWPPITSCDPVQSSEVRRFTQATMDDSRIYYDEAHARERKYGGLMAPGSFPITVPRRRAPGTPDPVVPGPGVSTADAAIGVGRRFVAASAPSLHTSSDQNLPTASGRPDHHAPAPDRA
jgi:hypothetical protein